MWSTSIEFSKKNYTIILYFCIFLRFTKETSCIKESCKSLEYLEKAFLRVKVEKVNFEICKMNVLKLLQNFCRPCSHS